MNTEQPKEPSRVAYHIERRGVCPSFYSNINSEIDKVVGARIAAGECLMAEERGDPQNVDFTVAETNFGNERNYGIWSLKTLSSSWWEIDRFMVPGASGRQVTVTKGGRQSGEVVFRQTRVEGQSFALPLYLNIAGYGFDIYIHIAPDRIEVRDAPDMKDVLKNKLGLKLDPVLMNLDQETLVRTIMAQPVEAASAFSPEQLTFVSEYVKALGTSPLTSKDLELLRGVLRDKRLGPIEFLRVYNKGFRAKDLVGLLPDMLDRLATSDPVTDKSLLDGINLVMKIFSREDLLPYAQRLRAIATAAWEEWVKGTATAGAPEAVASKRPTKQNELKPDRATAIKGVLTRVGEIAPQSLPQLEAFLEHPDWTVRESAAIGICRLGWPAALQAVESLRKALNVEKQPRRNYFRPIVRTLIRLGRKDELQRLLEQYPSERPDYNYELNKLEADFPVSECWGERSRVPFAK